MGLGLGLCVCVCVCACAMRVNKVKVRCHSHHTDVMDWLDTIDMTDSGVEFYVKSKGGIVMLPRGVHQSA